MIHPSEFLRLLEDDVRKLPSSIKEIERNLKVKIQNLEAITLSDERTIVIVRGEDKDVLMEITSTGFLYFPYQKDPTLLKEVYHGKDNYDIDLIAGPVHWINNVADYLKENPDFDLTKKID